MLIRAGKYFSHPKMAGDKMKDIKQTGLTEISAQEALEILNSGNPIGPQMIVDEPLLLEGLIFPRHVLISGMLRQGIRIENCQFRHSFQLVAECRQTFTIESSIFEGKTRVDGHLWQGLAITGKSVFTEGLKVEGTIQCKVKIAASCVFEKSVVIGGKFTDGDDIFVDGTYKQGLTIDPELISWDLCVAGISNMLKLPSIYKGKVCILGEHATVEMFGDYLGTVEIESKITNFRSNSAPLRQKVLEMKLGIYSSPSR